MWIYGFTILISMRAKLAIIASTLFLVLVYLHYSGVYNISYIHIGEFPTILLILVVTAIIVYYEHFIKTK